MTIQDFFINYGWFISIVLLFVGVKLFKDWKTKTKMAAIKLEQMEQVPQQQYNIYTNMGTIESQRETIKQELELLKKQGESYRQKLATIHNKYDTDRAFLDKDHLRQVQAYTDKLQIGKTNHDFKVRQLEALDDMLTLQKELDMVERQNE
ncbi:MAG: hypothetical protein DRP42_04235 [Tenericutes bacterium]|nr:MAG: hypothetical protein DRP42_04235 [Mycoplasmatota bacterium]